VREASGHRWSGWPGAYCLYCGGEDANEIALADGMEPDETYGDLNDPCPATEEQKLAVDRRMNPDRGKTVCRHGLEPLECKECM